MGLLDKFRKKQPEKDQIHEEDNNKEFLRNAKFSMTKDGRLQVDFYDREADFRQFYDVTRLIASIDTINLGGHPVHNCVVSWYGENDAIMFDSKGMDLSRRTQYREVLAEINLEQLRTDYNYCEAVMKGLLNKERVEKYLSRGLQENPENPCGKYIGGVRKTPENTYQKFFSKRAGEASHNSEFMINRRREVRENEEKRKQQLKTQKEAQIKKLQEEIEGLEL